MKSFQSWHGTSVAVPTDPNTLHDMAERLLGLQIVDMTEAAAIAAPIVDRTQKVGDHGAIYALVAPAVERFKAKPAKEQDEVRDALDGYVRAYSFLSQVVDFGDVGLEALYLTSRSSGSSSNDTFIKSIVGRMDDNEDIFRKILDEPEFQAVVMNYYLQRVFERARTQPPRAPA